MSSDPVIRVNKLSKSFPIYAQPSDRLKQFIFPRLQRLFGLSPKKYYRAFDALSDVSFEIQRGETVGIIGRNGAGKSTLLQILCGTLAPTSGEVEVKGRVAALLELGAGFNGEYSGRENVYLNARILGLTDGEIAERLDQIIQFAEIGEHIDQPVKTYSSGMFVRLAFSVVVHVNADVLIVDEALSVGDAFFQAKCMLRLKDFVGSGGTLLFVSHEIGAVKALCNGAIWIRDGTIAAIGNTPAVTSEYTNDWTRHQNSNVNKLVSQSDDALAESGAIVSLGLRLSNSSGSSGQTAFEFGETVCLHISLISNARLEKLIVSVHIKDRLQQHLLGMNSGVQSSIYEKGVEPNCNTSIEFKFPARLQHGTYTCTIVLSTISDVVSYSDARFIKWLDNALCFEVRQRVPLPLSDLVELPYEVVS
jgi:lipopolysaccharide transport system ATP-binding protein